MAGWQGLDSWTIDGCTYFILLWQFFLWFLQAPSEVRICCRNSNNLQRYDQTATPFQVLFIHVHSVSTHSKYSMISMRLLTQTNFMKSSLTMPFRCYVITIESFNIHCCPQKDCSHELSSSALSLNLLQVQWQWLFSRSPFSPIHIFMVMWNELKLCSLNLYKLIGDVCWD